jgi:hypothetical protein
MISLIFAIIALAWLARSYQRDRTFLFVSAFLAWQFALKVMATVYLDNFGPIYSDEVFIWVGGHGSSTPLMVVSVVIPLVIIQMLIPRRIGPPPAPESGLDRAGVTLADATYWGMVALLAALYVDMLRIGNIPFLSGLERFEYEGGIFHRFVGSYQFLLGFWIGAVIVRGVLLTTRWDLRFIPVTAALFLYLLLTGHRFGIFYVLVTAALFPCACLILAKKFAIGPQIRADQSDLWQRLIRSRVAITVLASTLVVFILGAMLNNLLFVRNNVIAEALTQRFFVQPSHMYYMTWERVHEGYYSGFKQVYSFLENPFDPGRNTGVQYLMNLHLGSDRAYQVYVRQQVDYAGGYPEIFLEIGGIWTAIGAAIVLSAALGFLYRLSLVSILRGRMMTALMSFYVSVAFINVFLGGMLETFVAKTFWLKIVLLAGIYAFERGQELSGRRIIPWVLSAKR